MLDKKDIDKIVKEITEPFLDEIKITPHFKKPFTYLKTSTTNGELTCKVGKYRVIEFDEYYLVRVNNEKLKELITFLKERKLSKYILFNGVIIKIPKEYVEEELDEIKITSSYDDKLRTKFASLKVGDKIETTNRFRGGTEKYIITKLDLFKLDNTTPENIYQADVGKITLAYHDNINSYNGHIFTNLNKEYNRNNSDDYAFDTLKVINNIDESQNNKIGIFPGSFSPPHRGHFEVVKNLAEQCSSVKVFISPKTRDGITAEQSLSVWNLYKKELPENVEISISESSPMKEAYDFIASNPNSEILAAFGKTDGDRFKQILSKDKYKHAKLFDAGNIDGINATELRKAIKDNDVEKITKLIPEGIKCEDFLEALKLELDEIKITPHYPKLKLTWSRQIGHYIFDYGDEIDDFIIFYDYTNEREMWMSAPEGIGEIDIIEKLIPKGVKYRIADFGIWKRIEIHKDYISTSDKNLDEIKITPHIKKPFKLYYEYGLPYITCKIGNYKVYPYKSNVIIASMQHRLQELKDFLEKNNVTFHYTSLNDIYFSKEYIEGDFLDKVDEIKITPHIQNPLKKKFASLKIGDKVEYTNIVYSLSIPVRGTITKFKLHSLSTPTITPDGIENADIGEIIIDSGTYGDVFNNYLVVTFDGSEEIHPGGNASFETLKVVNKLNEAFIPNQQVGEYKYKGLDESEILRIATRIGQMLDSDEDPNGQEYKDFINQEYDNLVKNNPELGDIATEVEGYRFRYPKHDIVFGAISGIPPKDIKLYVEITKGFGGLVLPDDKRDKTKQYITLKEIKITPNYPHIEMWANVGDDVYESINPLSPHSCFARKEGDIFIFKYFFDYSDRANFIKYLKTKKIRYNFKRYIEIDEKYIKIINKPEELDEIKITTNYEAPIDSQYREEIKDKLVHAIKKEYIGTSNINDFVEDYLVYDLNDNIEKYFKEIMYKAQAEIIRNGQAELVDSSNIETVTKEEIVDFVLHNKPLRRQINLWIVEFYLKGIDFSAIYNKVLRYMKSEEKEYDYLEHAYSKNAISNSIDYVLYELEGEGEIMSLPEYIDEYEYLGELNTFLLKKIRIKFDFINEIKITPNHPYIELYNLYDNYYELLIKDRESETAYAVFKEKEYYNIYFFKQYWVQSQALKDLIFYLDSKRVKYTENGEKTKCISVHEKYVKIVEVSPLNEIQQKDKLKDLKTTLNDFLKFIVKELNLKILPKLTLSQNTDEVKNQSSFANYDPNNNKIWVYVKNRNQADILRSISHEMIHAKQNEDGRLKSDSGETGSEIENEANAQAGILLRKYGKINKNIYEGLQKEIKIIPHGLIYDKLKRFKVGDIIQYTPDYTHVGGFNDETYSGKITSIDFLVRGDRNLIPTDNHKEAIQIQFEIGELNDDTYNILNFYPKPDGDGYEGDNYLIDSIKVINKVDEIKITPHEPDLKNKFSNLKIGYSVKYKDKDGIFKTGTIKAKRVFTWVEDPAWEGARLIQTDNIKEANAGAITLRSYDIDEIIPEMLYLYIYFDGYVGYDNTNNEFKSLKVINKVEESVFSKEWWTKSLELDEIKISPNPTKIKARLEAPLEYPRFIRTIKGDIMFYLNGSKNEDGSYSHVTPLYSNSSKAINNFKNNILIPEGIPYKEYNDRQISVEEKYFQIVDKVDEIKITPTPIPPSAIPMTFDDFKALLAELSAEFGERILNNENYQGIKKRFQYGSLYNDAISFGFHLENIQEEDKEKITEIIRNFAQKHRILRGVWKPNFHTQLKFPETNVRIGLYAPQVSPSGGHIGEIKITSHQTDKEKFYSEIEPHIKDIQDEMLRIKIDYILYIRPLDLIYYYVKDNEGKYEQRGMASSNKSRISHNLRSIDYISNLIKYDNVNISNRIVIPKQGKIIIGKNANKKLEDL